MGCSRRDVTSYFIYVLRWAGRESTGACLSSTQLTTGGRPPRAQYPAAIDNLLNRIGNATAAAAAGPGDAAAGAAGRPLAGGGGGGEIVPGSLRSSPAGGYGQPGAPDDLVLGAALYDFIPTPDDPQAAHDIPW